MAVYCGSCGQARGYPLGSIRSGGDTPCDFCGNVESMKQLKPHPNPRFAAEGKKKEVLVILGNYSYPDHLLPGHPRGRDAEAAREREGVRK